VECTHLHWGAGTTPDEGVAERKAQVRALLDHERPEWPPTLLMGDFNAIPGSLELAGLEAPGSGFVDAWSTRNPAEPGHTIPVEAPARRIDYIWLAGPVTCTAIAVLDSNETRLASDHFPVVADLWLPADGLQ
jgi:endonuclease/exonuclease/phosphatase family metal-dependent hydrolase